MDTCKCIVPLRYGGTLNSRRAASPLVWLMEEVEKWEAPDHPKVCSLKIGVETSQIVLSHVWCSKLRLTTGDLKHLRSPDLNPIENVWMHLDTEVRERNVTSKENLKEKLQEVWKNSIDTEITKKLIESMPRRREAVIKANGLFTKY
ncbi:hypothetical protein TNCV_278131 [Trichonephila clavipes]|nr:hypothetical protein TNCV_278131 [Trichonephila clavipes]